MFWLNVNPSQEIITEADYIWSQWQIVNNGAINSVNWYWLDSTNNYVYFCQALSSAPRFKITRRTITNWLFTNSTLMTLSWFWTLTSYFDFRIYQWSRNWNFQLYVVDKWWSASLVNWSCYPITISWTTATVWSWIAVPVIASKTLSFIACYSTKVYAFYSLTAWPNTLNDWRKYDWWWTSLTWTALPTAIWTFWNTQNMVSNYHNLKMPAGTNADKHWLEAYDASGYSSALKFDFATETRENMWIWEYSWVSSDVNWNVFISTYMITPDLNRLKINGLNPGNLHYWPQKISEWLFNNYVWWSNYYFAWFFSWNDRRIRKIHSVATSSLSMLYSLDWWATRKCLNYVSTLISADYNLNYFWDLKVLWIYPTDTNVLAIEIV